MPRDDLSIDFVKKMAPSIEAQDPVVILEEFIHRMANLPEEVRFIQDEIADKDRSYHECIKSIEESDNKIQRFIRSNGSHHHNPREAQLRLTMNENYTRAEKLAEEKVALSLRAKNLYDKHLRYLDLQIKQLTDRGEPGFTDPDEIPSLIRPSAANNSNTSVRVLSVTTTSQPLNPIHNTTTPAAVARLATSQARAAQTQAHISSSAPTSPAASMILNRGHRESSAGPGSGVPKRGPRTAAGIGNIPANSSGLARHASIGPGTPKAGTPGGPSRAGSAGPKGVIKASSTTSRKGTPSGPARKRPPTSKSTLSRVKRAGQPKGSPASTADSELSDADSAPSSRRGSRAGSGTPVPSHSGSQKQQKPTAPDADKDEEMADRDDEDEDVSNSDGVSGIDDDEDEEGKRYCLCQAVSYGDMVACDNPSCPFEWFHWSCVGLKSEPEGRWYCPTCSAERAESLKKKGK
ncbi:inhibitor of growth proteins N-terminal histone-binding-domain-containing protein [Astrocystis sublimbata]|nr:inhibitor of growth proteins N-terminal histone-binding-domain-containing protein [Astrocystis sublimbata]